MSKMILISCMTIVILKSRMEGAFVVRTKCPGLRPKDYLQFVPSNIYPAFDQYPLQNLFISGMALPDTQL